MVPLSTLPGLPVSPRGSERCPGVVRATDIDRYRPAIHAYLRRRGFTGEDVEDLTQETLIRAYLHLPKFRGTNVSGWLYRIAGNLAVDHVRRQRRSPQLSLDSACLQPAVAGNPEASLLGSGNHSELLSHIEALSPDQRELLRLRFQERRSVREIAERLNCTTGAAKLRLFRTIETLRRRAGETVSR